MNAAKLERKTGLCEPYGICKTSKQIGDSGIYDKFDGVKLGLVSECGCKKMFNFYFYSNDKLKIVPIEVLPENENECGIMYGAWKQIWKLRFNSRVYLPG